MPRVEADLQMFTQWALDTLIIALEVNDPSEPTPRHWSRNNAFAKRELVAIIQEVRRIGDASTPVFRQIALRVIRRAAQMINDGVVAEVRS